jgi:uncharacterized protein (TIGR03437 family)
MMTRIGLGLFLVTGTAAFAQRYVISTVAGGAPPPTPAPALSSSIGSVRGVATDASGNVYFSTDLHCVFRVDANGVLYRVAGNCRSGYSGDGGRATSAQLSSPTGIAVDAVGNLFIADAQNARIRRVSVSGIITTVAGNGTFGRSGDGGPATSAQLGATGGVAVDAAGNLFVPDGDNHRIRRVSPNGTVTTVAGNGTGGYSGDGGPATSAQLFTPLGVAVDAAGNLFIADGRNSRIRRVSPSGIITTVAGNGTSVYSGDGGPATSASIVPSLLAAGPLGRIYIADLINNAVRVLTPAGPELTVSAVTNAASNTVAPFSPRQIVVLYAGIGPPQLTHFSLNGQGMIGTELAGTRVLFNGTPAPILYTWVTQVAAIVPYSVTGTSAQVQVEYQGQTTDPLTVPVAASAPGVFTLDSSGRGQAAAVNQDGSLNTAMNAARQGSIVSFYVTGEGQTSPSGVDGKLAAPPLPIPILPVAVTIGGRAAEVTYAGGAPTLVAGVMQVNARIPSGTPAGNAAVVVTVGGAASQAGVTVVVPGIETAPPFHVASAFTCCRWPEIARLHAWSRSRARPTKSCNCRSSVTLRTQHLLDLGRRLATCGGPSRSYSKASERCP